MRQLWRSVLDTLTPYDAGRPLEALARELGLAELARLSANESPLGPAPGVIAALEVEARRAHLYPDGSATELRTALGRRLGVDPAQVVVGNGADEILGLLAQAALEPGAEAILPQPGFEPYGTVIALAGAIAHPSPLRGYETDLDDMLGRVGPATRLVFVCSPHNPAGTLVRRGPLAGFLDALGPDGPLVVLDEAYRDFADDPDTPDGVALLGRYPRLVVLRTFSKIAGLAGLRVGFGVGATEVVERLHRVRAPYNVNRLAQAAALAALADEAHWEATRRHVVAERAWLARELDAQGHHVVPSQANFLLVRVADARAALAALLGAGILVRDGAAVGFPGHLRIAIGSTEVNRRLAAILGGTRP